MNTGVGGEGDKRGPSLYIFDKTYFFKLYPTPLDHQPVRIYERTQNNVVIVF
jgi:hypothetical protein